MQPIIDTPYNLGRFAERLADEGVRTVIRYYNTKNSPTFPEKCLTKAEAKQYFAAGLNIAVVYQQRGGAGDQGHIDDFSDAMAARDAASALKNAKDIGQPAGSAIYFGVDHDFFRQPDLDVIKAYFAKVGQALKDKYRVGVYGSGTVCSMLKRAGLASLFWLPRSMGWSGSRAFFASGEWTLFQNMQELHEPWGAFDYDANQFNPAFADFGQFSRSQAEADLTPEARSPFPPVAAYEIIARSGVQLRRGPGTEFVSDGAHPAHTIVNALREENGWLQVDVNGDGLADGFMKASLLRAVSGGLTHGATTPAAHPAPTTAYDFAKVELAKDIAEIRGAQNNPRIVLYHSLTVGGAAPDETAWCSSFVNFCVSQAGLTGTRSKWARSWHDQRWGREVTAAPIEGDIVVWRRRSRSVDGGHVAFFVDDLGDSIRVLGGNQSNKVCITSYPKNGTAGSQRYDLLSIRR